MKITKFSLRQPVLVNLIMILIIIVGLVSWCKMPREIFPTIERRTIRVTTMYPGVAPGEIEELITIPLERAIATVEDIEQITATSEEGRSTIAIELKDDVSDPSRVLLDIQTAVARVSELPAEVDDPLVKLDKFQSPMIWLALGATVPEHELKRLAQDLKSDLEEINGVSEALVFGIRTPQITVEVDPSQLVARQLSINDVMGAIRRKHVNVPGGTLYGKRGEYLIRTVGRFKGGEAVKRIVVRANENGTVLVTDVANVSEGFKDRVDASRVMSKPAAFVMVYRQTDADAITVTEEIQRYLKRTKSRYPEGAEVVVLWDSTKAIKKRQETLYQNGAMGLLLVMLLLFVFLDWRMALMTSLGIPISFFGAFVLMRLMGVTLNMVSMFALIMVLGMLVDDAIIVVENFYRHLMMGKSRLEAALVGGAQVVWPVIAAVATTVVAYLVLIRLPGPMGKVMAIMPMVVSAALAVSLIEALLILPSHLHHVGRRIKGVREPTAAEAAKMLGPYEPLPVSKHVEAEHDASHEARWFLFVQRGFRALLRALTRRWYVSLPVMAVAFIVLFGWAVRGNKFVSFPVTTVERFDISVELATGTKLERTSRVIARFEKKLASYPRQVIDSYLCRIGMRSLGQGRTKPGSHLGTCTVLMAKDGKGPVPAPVLLRQLRPFVERLPGVEKTQVTFMRAGPPAGNPIELQVRGDDEARIMVVVQELMAIARKIPGAQDITHDMDAGKRELQVVVDEEQAARRGLDVSAIGLAVRNAFGGGVATKLQRGEDEIEVLVRFPDRLRHRTAEIESLQIRSPQGGLVPFKAVARLEETIGPSSLVRLDRKRTVTVYGQVDETVTTAEEVNRKIRGAIPALTDRHPGISIKFGGEQKRSRELRSGLAEAGMIALLLIYLILATIFRSFLQPLIIMLGSIPFALVGVMVGLRIHGMPISIIGILGFVGLMGIVVNDSLVLVDFVNKARDDGLPMSQAVVDAGTKRLRPVLLTSVTTIAGLLPLATGWFGAEEFLQPMAVTIVWGLAFSTVLILLMVPCMVLAVEAVKRAFLFVFWAVWRAIKGEDEPDAGSGPESDPGPNPDPVG